MVRRILAIALCSLLACAPLETMAQGIKTKPVDPASGRVLEPSPSFRNIQRRGQQELAPGIPGTVSSGGAKMPSGLDSLRESFGGISGAQMDMGYQVHVLGEVMNPGTYRINASERVSEVLERAGGISETGSERKIKVKRGGKKTRIVDLFRFRTQGHLEDNPYLTDNDVVFVPLLSKMVQVVGTVRRPGYYELKNENTLYEIVKLAGGLNIAAAREQPMRVVRFVNGNREVMEVPMTDDSMRSFRIRNGDVIVAPNVVTAQNEFDYNVITLPGDQPFYPSYEDRVFVLGGVISPGPYPFSPHYKIHNYITLAGGISDLGKEKVSIIKQNGDQRTATLEDRVNPGETIYVQKRIMRAIDWVGFSMGMASFGLSTTATVLALTR